MGEHHQDTPEPQQWTDADCTLAAALHTLATRDGTPRDSACERVNKFVRPMVGRLLGAWRKAIPPEDAEQLVWVSILRTAHHYDKEKGLPAAWLAVLIRNTLLNTRKELRADKRTPDRPIISLEAEKVRGGSGRDDGTSLKANIPDPHPVNPHARLEDREAARLAVRALRRLWSPTEFASYAARLSGDSYDEIGEQLGIDRKSVDNAVQRAERKLVQAQKRHPETETLELLRLLLASSDPRTTLAIRKRTVDKYPRRQRKQIA